MNNLFNPSVYQSRRAKLVAEMKSGVALFLGNHELPMSYKANTFPFRQDSSFLYFFGLSLPNLAAIIDFDENREILFGDDIDIDDIIWMGVQPSMQELGERVGVKEVRPFSELKKYIQGRELHFLPPYQAENKILLSNLTGKSVEKLGELSSVPLIQAIVKLRSKKEANEIEQIEEACKIGVLMHETIMKSCKSGVSEQYLAGLAEGVTLSYGKGVSFPVILSQRGEVLHNHRHDGILKKGNLLLVDAGAENNFRYTSDYTRTLPVDGVFETKQREIYEIVLRANTEAIASLKPDIYYRNVHLFASQIIAEGLKELGLMKGDIQEAVKVGAHALFFPHGLGHQMGLDVHDMENLGENFVGYDDTISRSKQFGLSALRMGRKLQEGFVITVEPGIYFIPDLIDIWKKERKFEQFINYAKVEEYRDFGGIRIEDDVLITGNSHRVLGPPLAKTVDELQKMICS
jgi:Xaa-Pro aminopeptidase